MWRRIIRVATSTNGVRRRIIRVIRVMVATSTNGVWLRAGKRHGTRVGLK